MSGLVCLDVDLVVDLNRIICAREGRNTGTELYMLMGDKGSPFYINQDQFAKLKQIVMQRQDTQNTLEQLTKENQHLRSIIAAMPGFGEDYKTAKIEFEEVTRK